MLAPYRYAAASSVVIAADRAHAPLMNTLSSWPAGGRASKGGARANGLGPTRMTVTAWSTFTGRVEANDRPSSGRPAHRGSGAPSGTMTT